MLALHVLTGEEKDPLSPRSTTASSEAQNKDPLSPRSTTASSEGHDQDEDQEYRSFLREMAGSFEQMPSDEEDEEDEEGDADSSPASGEDVESVDLDEYNTFLREMAGSFEQAPSDDEACDGEKSDGGFSTYDYPSTEENKLSPGLTSESRARQRSADSISDVMDSPCGTDDHGVEDTFTDSGIWRMRRSSSGASRTTISSGPSQWLLQALQPVQDDYDVAQAIADYEENRRPGASAEMLRLQDLNTAIASQIRQASKLLQRVRGGSGSDGVLEHYRELCVKMLEEAAAMQAERQALCGRVGVDSDDDAMTEGGALEAMRGELRTLPCRGAPL